MAKFDCALKYIKESAKLKCSKGQYKLGTYYETGKYLEKNYCKALELYEDSAIQDYDKGQNAYAKLLFVIDLYL